MSTFRYFQANNSPKISVFEVNPCGAGPVYRREKKCQIVLLVAWYVTSKKSRKKFFSRSNHHGWKEDEICYRLQSASYEN